MSLSRKEVLVKHPRLVSHLISESLGYFTPLGAAEAIRAYKENKSYPCEFFSHIASSSEYFDLKEANRYFIKSAILNRNRHHSYMEDYTTAKTIVKRVLEDGQPKTMLAGWF